MDQDSTVPQPPAPRRTTGSKLAGALIGAVAALSIGGVGLAFAQESQTPTTETPTTEAPAAETPATPEADGPRGDREDCPDKAGAEGGGTTATATADEV